MPCAGIGCSGVDGLIASLMEKNRARRNERAHSPIVLGTPGAGGTVGAGFEIRVEVEAMRFQARIGQPFASVMSASYPNGPARLDTNQFCGRQMPRGSASRVQATATM